MRRRGGYFPFYCVVVLEILQYFCVLPPWKDEKSPASAVEDFCGECPSMAARRTVENIPGYFEDWATKRTRRSFPQKRIILWLYCLDKITNINCIRLRNYSDQYLLYRKCRRKSIFYLFFCKIKNRYFDTLYIKITVFIWWRWGDSNPFFNA